MIVRDHATVVIRAVHAPAGEALKTVLCQRGDGATVVVSDLSMGAWRDHQISSEWIDQLGIQVAVATPYIRETKGQHWLNYANVIGQGIEREAKGRITVRAPLNAASLVIDHARSSPPIMFVVIAPRGGRRWGNDNEEFLRFFAQGLKGLGSELLVCITDDEFAPTPSALWQWKLEGSKLPAAAPGRESLASIVPTTVAPAMAEVLENLDAPCDGIELANGTRVVSPECRTISSGTALYNTLAQSTMVPPWIRAYAQMHGDVADEMFLLRQSWWMYMAGSYDLALLLAQRAVDCAIDDVSQEICRTQLAGMQIGTYHFAEAGAQAEPADDTPPGLRGFLLMAKGWGLTLSGNAAEGTKYLEMACDLSRSRSKTVEFKYLLNIFALSRARSGHFAEAKELELGIHDSLRRERIDDQRIRYVNSINLARLSRWERNYDLSAAYYQEAFDTTLGSRTEGERVYVNVCIGRVLDARGDRDAAFLHWFRAGLHFVACQVPEAFSARYIQALVLNSGWLVHDSAGMVETICSKLFEQILEHAPSPALHAQLSQAVDDSVTAPAFIQSEVKEALVLPRSRLIAAGRAGWSVLASDLRAECAFNGAAHRVLRRALAAIIDDLAPELRAMNQTYVIDARNDREMAVTLPELIEVCLRQRVARLHFEGQTIEVEAADSATELDLRLELGGAVQAVEFDGDFATVRYKRFWPDRKVEDPFGLVRCAVDGGQLLRALCEEAGEGQTPEIIAAARKLEADRVICLELPVDAHRPTETRAPRQAHG